MIEKNVDNLERRCPRLGHSVSFQYCRTCGETMNLCWKIADCWWEIFDIMAWLKANLPEEDLNLIMENRAPKPKITSLVELIEEARKRSEQ